MNVCGMAEVDPHCPGWIAGWRFYGYVHSVFLAGDAQIHWAEPRRGAAQADLLAVFQPLERDGGEEFEV
jgi:uncharacterized protein (DUF58 family)